MNRAGSPCQELGALVKRNKNQLCDYKTNEPVLLTGIIPRSRLTGLEIFYVITLAGSARGTKPATGQWITQCACACALLPVSL